VDSTLRKDLIEQQAGQFNREVHAQLSTNEWKKNVSRPGHLTKFIGKYGQGLRYEPFRDLIIARMRDADYKPGGMKAVVDQILTDVWTSGNRQHIDDDSSSGGAWARGSR